MRDSAGFFKPIPNRFLIKLFAHLNRIIFSADVTWRIDEASLDRWRGIPRDAGLLIAVKHAHYSDEYCIYELAARVGTYPYYVSVPEVFEGFMGIPRWFTRRFGGFPVERGGRNVHATRFIIDVFSKGEAPIVIFPEGELFFLNDFVTPLKQGTAFFALEGAKARRAAGKPGTMFILPVGLKYVYPGDPTPILKKKLSELERKFFGSTRKGDVFPRTIGLTEGILSRAESEFEIALPKGSVERRFLALAEGLVARLEKAHGHSPAGDLLDRARKLLEQSRGNEREYRPAFFALHSLAFLPGYLDQPSPERVMETLRKCDRLITGNDRPAYPGHRLLFMQIQEPIKVDAYLPSYLASREGKKEAMGRLLGDLRASMQAAVDSLGEKARNVTGQAGWMEAAGAGLVKDG